MEDPRPVPALAHPAVVRAVAALAALALVLGACSDSRPAIEDLDTGPVDEEVPEVADLGHLALSIDDLPPGWTEVSVATDGDGDDDGDTIECMRAIEELGDQDPVGEAEASFAHEAGTPTLQQSLAQLDAATITESLDVVAAALDGCSTFEDTTSRGEVVRGQVSRAAFDPIAGAERQETFAMTASVGDMTATTALLLLQKGDHLMLLAWLDLEPYDPAQVAAVAGTALAKL